MKTYPQQHEPWRPDYPPVWNGVVDDEAEGLKVVDISQPWDSSLQTFNIEVFTKTLIEINKAMKL